MPTPLRVLILEDSPTDAGIIVRHLCEAGYAPDWRRVETEADFLTHLEPALDLILIDYTLPNFDGRRALKILRERGWDIPTVIVSGTIGEETALELLRLGAADYLLKDRLARLGAAVQTSLAQRALRRERAMAEGASRASEAQARFLADVLEKSAQPFGIGYPDGRLGFCNTALCELLSQTEDNLRALNWLRDLTPPEWHAAEAERLAELERTGQPVRYEKEYLRKDGSRVPVELLVHLVRDTADGLSYYYAFVTDITERKRAEQALAERTRQLEAVRSVTAEITRELNLTDLLNLIIQRAAELVGAGSGRIWLWDEEAQALASKAWYGPVGGRGEVRLHLGQGMTGTIAKRREGLIVNDYQASPYLLPVLRGEAGFTALMGEPLLYHDRLLGVLTLSNRGTGRSFTEQNRETLALFASQAAIAIENARLYEVERERRRELEAIRAVTAEITRELDLTSLLALFVKRATELLGVSSGSVRLWDEEAGILIVRAWQGYPDWVGKVTFSLDEGIGGQVAQRRKGMIVNDYRASPHAVPIFLERTTITGILAEPLMYRDRLLGVISVDNMATRRPFTEQDQKLLALLATHAAIGIENARLHESALLRAKQLTTLNELAQTLTATLDPQAVAREILAAAQVLIPETVGQLWDLGKTPGEFRLLAIAGTRTPASPFCTQFPAGEGLAGLACSTRQYVTTPDVRQDPRFVNRAWAVAEGLVSCIALPLVHQERVHGSLGILTRTPHVFREVEIDLLQAFAAHAAIALENATLFHAVSEGRAEVRTLAGRLADAEEGERKRLARDLHDQVGGNLTALGINLNILRSQAGMAAGPEVQSRLDDSFRLVDEAAERIRDIMGELRPPVLDDYGLVAALRWYAETFSSRTQILAEVQGEEPAPRLQSAVEIALFRIAQEALTNVTKHAGATRVRIAMETTSATARLVIADDGAGFDPSRLEGRSRWGLMTMSERAKAVGGHCAIDSQPGRGTWVVVEAPR